MQKTVTLSSDKPEDIWAHPISESHLIERDKYMYKELESVQIIIIHQVKNNELSEK